MTDTTGIGTLDAQRLELLRRRIAQRGLARPTVAAEADATADGRQIPEMSDGQRRMWFVQSVDPDGALLNICVSYRVSGNVDVARLRQAVAAIALRHPMLRTIYQTDGAGDPYPVIRDDLRPGWAEHDLSGLAEQARRLRLEVLAQRQFGQPFDLTKDSPLRIATVRVSADELILLLTAHHIAWDDGSWAPFFTDLTRAYTDADSTAGPPARLAVATDPVRNLDEDLAYWRSLMTDLPEPLELPGPNGSVVPSTWRAQRATARLSAGTI
ncbi:MAG: mycobactin peptide synthetase MbtE, partial [Mycobacterium sp.]|nr:mycobactin peptide synthetase MbtE [Mycobacterium sp.]